MKTIHIMSIPHKDQRYNTCGDYWETPEGTIEIRVDDLGDEKEETMIIIHELIELFLTKVKGISWEEIDKFDKELDKTHPELEPGDQPEAPYYHQHQIACIVERILCPEVGMNWEKYNSPDYREKDV